MHSRFPNTSLLRAFGVMSLRPISFMSEEELKADGEEELELLIAHYGHEQTVKWKEVAEDHQMTTLPLNAEQTREEWALVKKVVKAQHYSRDSMWKLWALVTKYHLHDFPNLTILAQIATTWLCIQLAANKDSLHRTSSSPLTGTGCHQNIKSSFSRSAWGPKGQSSLLKRHWPNGKRSSREGCSL